MKTKLIVIIAILAVSALLLVGCAAGVANPEGGQYGRGNTQDGYGDAQSDVCGDGIAQGGYGNAQANRAGSEATPVQEETGAAVTADTQLTEAELAGYGSAGALSDDDLSLADMLTYALQDEYLAHAEYAYIIDAYGSARPFSNIIAAEETHISQLLPLFSVYGIQPPADNGAAYVAAVGSLTEAYQAGEQAEINNIAMYDAFLAQDLPADVRIVFESLRAASESHLSAFRNHL